MRKMAEKSAVRAHGALRRGALLAAKLALAAGLVAWLWRSGRLDFHEIARIHVGYALLGVVAGQAVVLLVPILRWSFLLKAREIELTARQIVQIGLISYFAVLILPATGGQEAVRLYYASRVSPGRGPDILATLVLDRFIGLVGLCVLALTSGVLLLIHTGSPVVIHILYLVVALLVVLGGITVFLLRAKPKSLRGLIERSAAMTALFRSLEAFRGRWSVLVTALTLSCVAHFGSCASMYLGFLAIGAPVSLVEACAITPLVTLTSSVPITPLGLGVADVVAEKLFSMVGALHGAAVTMLVRAVTAIACLACGIAYLVPVPESVTEKNPVGED